MNAKTAKLIRRHAVRTDPERKDAGLVDRLKQKWYRTPRNKRVGLAARMGRLRKRWKCPAKKQVSYQG